MPIVPQYMPKALPKDFSTVETTCKMVQEYKKDDEGNFERDDEGRKIKAGPAQMVMDTKVESKGGILYTFPNGNSIRIASQSQMDLFKLTDKPKLINTDTGEEVDETGTPLSLAQYVNSAIASKGDFGLVDANEE